MISFRVQVLEDVVRKVEGHNVAGLGSELGVAVCRWRRWGSRGGLWMEKRLSKSWWRNSGG